MKTSLVLTAFVTLFVSSMTCFVFSELRQRPTVSATADDWRFVDLEEKLASLDRSLEDLSDLRERLSRLELTMRDPAPSPRSGETRRQVSASYIEDLAFIGDVTRVLRGEEAEPKIHRMLEDFVGRVIEKKRSEGDQHARLEAQERYQEQQELHEGPYGRHNYQVNFLAKELTLGDRQKAALYDLLSQYNDDTRAQIQKDLQSVDWEKFSPEDQQESLGLLRETLGQIQREFDSQFEQLLDEEQRASYGELQRQGFRSLHIPG